MEAYRWVNNNDVVTRVPPGWLGYCHKGQEIYLNAYGQIRRLCPWQRTKDRWRGFLRGLRERRFDHFSDHSIGQYIEHIWNAVLEEERFIVPFLRPQLAPKTLQRRAA
jgi:triacylglycerol lipase